MTDDLARPGATAFVGDERLSGLKSRLGKDKLVRSLFIVLPAFIIVGGIFIGILGTLRTSETTNGSIFALQPAYESTAVMTSTTAVSPIVDGGLSAVVAGPAGFGPANPDVVAPPTIVLSQGSSPVTPSHSSPQVASPSQSPARSGSIEFFTNMTLRVSSPQSALTKAAGIAYSTGGYLAFSSSTNSSAIAVLRVPASQYQSALSQLEGIGNVTFFGSSSNDVTIKYTDLNATLQSLVTERDAFLRLLNQSTSLNNTIRIEGYLQGVNAQINSIQSEILQTRILIDYATITATFNRSAVRIPLGLKVVAAPLNGAAPLSVTFRSFVTGGVPGYIVIYNFGDGTNAQGEALIHTYTKAGNYNTTISATDFSGTLKVSWVMIHVSGAPVGFDFAGFTAVATNLFFGVIQGIVEVAVVLVPLTLVLAVVLIPLRNLRSRLRSNSKATMEKPS